ncbi:3-demethylubiquinone-9 3-methyltransferase [Candidatus Moduliflexus flocculans]|uniref:3-demethylubiquinone-9 3-methyltransferase n=1 Tax=Candidatus Moduliflexus flocculans TaxID=1499966 RepID=A0A0S6VRR0_9BACT|nr:3-demethylubiquinone-9 3-methyltransferase [Candidatus Moduliflexus flocculans]
MKTRQFAFGRNWQQYVEYALTPEKIEQARQAFRQLCDGVAFQDRTFLDIGFGQGLALCLAHEMGAKVLGIDIDNENVPSLQKTLTAFNFSCSPPYRIASILDDNLVEELRHRGEFDIVHSWGVLHHTGDMWQAICNAARLVKPDGVFILSIYNQHWSSPLWRLIKWSYNHAPCVAQRLFVLLFYPIIYLTKFLVTGQNPKHKQRGMDFFYDVVDWVGGYPYEYASAEAVCNFICRLGFDTVRVIPANIPTACNQFVFKKRQFPESLS